MSDLVRAELLKLRTVAMSWWLFLAALVVSILSVCVTVLTAGPDASVHLDDPHLLARAVARRRP